MRILSLNLNQFCGAFANSNTKEQKYTEKRIQQRLQLLDSVKYAGEIPAVETSLNSSQDVIVGRVVDYIKNYTDEEMSVIFLHEVPGEACSEKCIRMLKENLGEQYDFILPAAYLPKNPKNTICLVRKLAGKTYLDTGFENALENLDGSINYLNNNGFAAIKIGDLHIWGIHAPSQAQYNNHLLIYWQALQRKMIHFSEQSLVVIGDFNYIQGKSNAQSRALDAVCSGSQPYKKLIDAATYISGTQIDDIYVSGAFTRNYRKKYKIEVDYRPIVEGFADHAAIILNVED